MANNHHKLPAGNILLSRDQFRELVQERDGHRCVLCGKTSKEVALDSHHLIERRLWGESGGYFLNNGVSLCDPDCHMKAESTEVSCDKLRELAGISEVLLPPQLYPDESWDKWGNLILSDGTRVPGPLFWDESVQKVLQPVLHLFENNKIYFKPPRTYHLPWSPGFGKDDRSITDLTPLEECGDVVVTIKQDGENCSIYSDGYVHARKVEPLSTPNSERIKALAAELGCGEIPDGWRVCGENLIRQHTILYQNLIDHPRWFFQVFNIWKGDGNCLHWDELEQWAELLGLPTVPVYYRGRFEPRLFQSKGWTPTEFGGDPCEGYVVRPVESFHIKDYHKLVGKYVRKGFQQPQTHKWRYAAPVFNKPRTS
jgi:hypothetical protein